MDQEAFTAFYNDTAPALRGYIRRVSGEGESADDLLQETYLRFLRASPAADDRAARKAYLYKTATAAIYDRRSRSGSTRRRRPPPERAM
jgi:RNA polymerase sigma-70 factor (ECF subfamily)